MALLPVYYSALMSADSGDAVSPSAHKPKLLHDRLKQLGLPIVTRDPRPLGDYELAEAHSLSFVEAVMELRQPNGFGTKDASICRALRYTSGSMVDAALAALDEGAAASLSSGFHHATYGQAGGFCTFNGLVLAALAVHGERLGSRVVILDCDFHYGNGTDDIIRRLGLANWLWNVSLGGGHSFSDSPSAYFERLSKIEAELQAFAPAVILFQAGADLHKDDPLGGLLDTDDMRRRDALIFEVAARLRIPIAFNLAGGYQRDAAGTVEPVLALHTQTFEEAIRVFGFSGPGALTEREEFHRQLRWREKLLLERGAEGPFEPPVDWRPDVF